MIMYPVQIALVAVGAYALVGAVFAVAFVLRGAALMDTAVRASPVHVRAVLVPGAVALWPLLLRRWMRLTKERP